MDKSQEESYDLPHKTFFFQPDSHLKNNYSKILVRIYRNLGMNGLHYKKSTVGYPYNYNTHILRYMGKHLHVQAPRKFPLFCIKVDEWIHREWGRGLV